MLVGELMASPIMAQLVAELAKLTVHAEAHPEEEVSYSAAPEPVNPARVLCLFVMRVKPVPAVSADELWSASNPISMMSGLEVVTVNDGMDDAPDPVVDEATAKGCLVSILLTAKTMMNAPVTTPENEAEKDAVVRVPLLWPWNSPTTVSSVLTAVAVALFAIVGQLVDPLQLTVPSEGLVPTRATSAMMRSGN
jgi:hypothetical protein